MLTIDEKDILSFKTSLIKDLEKKIKMGYKSQFRNIVISITSMPKRYKKIKAPAVASEDMANLDDKVKQLTSYLLDMFDVFGDNAALNAKRIFEDNGNRWGKRFYKSYNQSYNGSDIKKLIRELYLSIDDIDYLSISNRQLNWTFKKTEECPGLSIHTTRYFNLLYEIKSIWLQHFIKAIAPGYTAALEVIEEDDNHRVINISVK